MWEVSGTCLGGVWDMFGTCLESVWKVFGTCLKVFGKCWRKKSLGRLFEQVSGDGLGGV